jgi:hypothetical protein
MATFPFPIEFPPNAPADLLARSTLLSRWLSSINPAFQVTSARVHSLDVWPGPRIGFVELDVHYTVNSVAHSERIVLSGGSVAVVPLIKSTTDGRLYTLLVEQPRIGCGKLTLEYPAGMADDSTDYRGVSVRELEEECGMHATEDELIDLGALFTPEGQFSLFPAMFDEIMSIFLIKRTMSEEELHATHGRAGGVDEEEQIVTRIVEFERVPEITPDASTIGITEVVRELLAAGKIAFD